MFLLTVRSTHRYPTGLSARAWIHSGWHARVLIARLASNSVTGQATVLATVQRCVATYAPALTTGTVFVVTGGTSLHNPQITQTITTLLVSQTRLTIACATLSTGRSDN